MASNNPADWWDVFGEAQPQAALAPEGTALDLFGGYSPVKTKRTHKHTWSAWRSDWRYMRCSKCGELSKSNLTAKVDR